MHGTTNIKFTNIKHIKISYAFEFHKLKWVVGRRNVQQFLSILGCPFVFSFADLVSVFFNPGFFIFVD
jgi:hypothetical protein